MVNVKIPAEIRAYKSKLIFGLSVRQLVSIIGALVTGVPLGVYGRGHIPDDLLIWMVMLTVVPFAAWGFLNFRDMRFEELVKVFVRFLFTPQIRVYEDTEKTALTNRSRWKTSCGIQKLSLQRWKLSLQVFPNRPMKSSTLTKQTKKKPTKNALSGKLMSSVMTMI